MVSLADRLDLGRSYNHWFCFAFSLIDLGRERGRKGINNFLFFLSTTGLRRI